MQNKFKKIFSGATLVAAGIFLSRIAGLIRERTFAHYFGNSDAGDAFKAALKIPNFLQNLFGEGVLSASFIPVYAGLLGKKEDEAAKTVAGSVFTLLALLTSVLVLIGVVSTPFLIDLIAPGFHGEKRELTIKLVQIFFPGTGLLVMSAWCLGILNSHHKFFLSYAAPVIWNVAIIASLMFYGANLLQNDLAIKVAWGLVLGSALQFLIQLPTTIFLIKKIKIGINAQNIHVKTIIKNFFPVVISRGVVQVSAYVDNMLASLLPTGAVSALAYAQTIYLLPVSLFGMAVTASELPIMSSATGTTEEIASYLRGRLDKGLKRIAFFIVPSVVAFLFLGDVIVSALFETGAFQRENTLYVWGVLAGSTVGLLASTLGRLYSSTFYALKDTRTPLKFAVIRVLLTTVLGIFCAFYLPVMLNLKADWGTAGLTASAGVSGWIEFYFLRSKLNEKIGNTGLNKKYLLKLWVVALVALLIGVSIKWYAPIQELHPVFQAIFILGPYGVFYLVIAKKV
jgi:putative peptidoglycan lipid II flippase